MKRAVKHYRGKDLRIRTLGSIDGKSKLRSMHGPSGRSVELGREAAHDVINNAPRGGSFRWSSSFQCGEKHPPRHPRLDKKLKKRIGKKLSQPTRFKRARRRRHAGKNEVRPQRGMRR